MSISGPSAATAMVSGVSALLGGVNSDLDSWPEEKRAIIIATATSPADQPLLTSTSSATDRRIGAGVVDAYQAVQLAQASWRASTTANTTVAENGHLGAYMDFTGVDAYGNYTTSWKAKITQSGRLRVVLTWDSIQGCPTGVTCSASDAPFSDDTLTGDLDLTVFRKAPGDTSWTVTGTSSSYSSMYDSSWEMIDIAVTAGDQYLIVPHVWLGGSVAGVSAMRFSG